MKIVSFTMVNNESEMIESFIRYNYNFVDEMIIIDNGSSDNTIEIIRLLIKEGYKITIYDESLEAYNQFRLDNKYLNIIIDSIQPDIILPLDDDEFIVGDGNPREILESLRLDRIYYIHWQWYVMTEKDDKAELFIPRRLKHCFEKPVWNYTGGTPVTKTVIPARYYRKMRLTLSMGHHTVFGNDNAEIEEISSLRLAHYRTVSEAQLISKISCYTMRGIAAMENNFETAHHTNQMAMIERGENMWETAVKASYGGYDGNIVYNPIELSYCNKKPLEIKYAGLSAETLSSKVLKTGREMAIRAYNSERRIKEKAFIKPVIVWMDGIRGSECIFPDPSNKATMLAELFNVRAYLTDCEEIKFLKANYRLIVTPEIVKFIPHKYIIISDAGRYDEIKNMLADNGLAGEKILSLKQYKKKLGIVGMLYCYIRFLPSMTKRIYMYFKRNGIKVTVNKIKSRLMH